MRCYNLLDQGPCKDGDWLVLDKTVHLDNSLEHSVAKVRLFYESNWLISWLRFLVLSHAQNFYVCLKYPFEFNWNLKSIFENWKFSLNLKKNYPVWRFISDMSPVEWCHVCVKGGAIPDFFLLESWSSGMEHFWVFGIPKKSRNRIFRNLVFPFGITEFSGFPNYW